MSIPKTVRRRGLASLAASGTAILLALGAPIVAAADDADCDADVAQVVSLGGAAWAQAPGEERRALTCDDVVRSCETIITAPGSRVGILNEDIYTLLGGDSRVVAVEREQGTELELKRGALRVVDARSGDDSQFVLRTRDALFRARDVDAELVLRVEPTGTFTRVCSHEGNVSMTPFGGAELVAGTAACAIADASGARLVEGRAPEIEVGSPLGCGLPVARLDERFDPRDVAAPPIGGSFPGIDPATDLARRPCDSPSVCGGVPQGAPPPPPGGTPPGGGPTPQPPIFVLPPPQSPCGGPGFPCP